MKPFKYYSTVPINYPTTEDFTTVHVYSKGAVVWSGSYEDFRSRRDADMFKGMLIERTIDKAALKLQRVAYGEEASRLQQEFKADLFEEHGVTLNPKANKCYKIAYDYGHHAGHKEVSSYFDTLVDLIKD